MQLADNEISSARQENEPLTDAITQARASIGDFFKTLRDPRRCHSDFRIKAVIQEGDRREHLWLTDLDFSTKPATGVVRQKPRLTTSAYRKRVPFKPEQMSDWMYRENGRVVGAYTIKAALQREGQDNGFFSQLKRRFLM